MGVAFSRYALSNPLHPDLFPSVRKMESEVVSMVLRLFNGNDACVGTMTSGGTESILLAMKAYRDYARKFRGVTDPEIVVPVTAHAAFDKAAAYFCIKLVHIPVDPVTFRADVAAMAKAITRNTVAIVGSAPCYPQGVIDPIPELGQLALKHGVPLHVDCCLGSFVAAHAAAAGFPTRWLFDFRVPGVTSISTDTHKYGFAPKGSSVIMYSDNKYRREQYFCAPEWTGGIYASPTFAGSRPGALVAGCWATMMHLGSAGYTDATRTIIAAARKITEGVRRLEHLGITLCGEPDLSVVCFGPAKGSKLNIYSVADAMVARGWNLNTLQNPASIHICVTFANASSADAMIADLEAALIEVRDAPPGKLLSCELVLSFRWMRVASVCQLARGR